MAYSGLWIKIDASIFDHPKTRRFARILNVTPEQAVGLLVRFWSWVIRIAPDGLLKNLDPEDIAEGACYQGDAQDFVNALISCGRGGSGFLETDGETYSVHDWNDYSGRLEKVREQNRDRLKRYRERKKQEQNTSETESLRISNRAVTVTTSLHNDTRGEENRGEENRGEDRREEEKISPSPPPSQKIFEDPWIVRQLDEIKKLVPDPKPKKLPEILDGLRDLYGAEATEREIKKALLWMAQKGKQRTNMGAFLGNWMRIYERERDERTSGALSRAEPERQEIDRESLSSEELLQHDLREAMPEAYRIMEEQRNERR